MHSAHAEVDPKAEQSHSEPDRAVHPSTSPTQGQVVMVTFANEDDRLLGGLGYIPELRREFTPWSTTSYAISLLGVLGSQPATYGIPISLGGPATAVWAWFIGSLMAYVIASCVAELVSAYPTAGGMYFVTRYVVPPHRVALWAWVMGWCNFLGQACGVASLAYTIGQMMLASASIWSDYTYAVTPVRIVGVSIAVLATFAVICSLTTKALHRLILWFAPINIFATLGICAALLTLNRHNLRDASFVFTDFRDGSGWGSRGFSFLLGFLNVAWVMTDYDGTTHMSEETHHAATRGPFAIRWAVIISGALGLLLNITFGFCLPENYMEEIVASPTGLPVAQIFQNAAGKKGGIGMLSTVILIQFFTGACAMLANARMAYAFARDRALPGSSLWSQIDPRTGTPVNAVWFVFAFCACLNLIGMGSTATITAVFNLCAPCLDLSYVAVLFARLLYVDRGELPFRPGPYTVGRWFPQPYRSMLAIGWVLMISVVLFFPPMWPVTPLNMNYAVVVAVAVALVSLGWFYLGGAKKTYTGPRLLEIREISPPRASEDHLSEEDRLPTPSYGSVASARG